MVFFSHKDMSQTSVQIYSPDGRLKFSSMLTRDAAQNKWMMKENINPLSSGYYLIRLNTGSDDNNECFKYSALTGFIR
jgi:hypothetical protein